MKTHITQWLQAWFDGELDPQLIPIVEQHLSTCETCREEMEAMAQLSVWLHEEDQELEAVVCDTSQDAFVNSVMHRIHDDNVQQESFFDSRIWKSIPAALVGVWLITQVSWTLLQGLRVMATYDFAHSRDGFTGGLDLLTRIGTLLKTNILSPGGFDYGIQGGIDLLVGDYVDLGLFLNGVLNPISLVSLAVGVMFAGWFAVWWLHQEQRMKITQLINNGG